MPALIDANMAVARDFGVRVVPSTVVIDTKGMIRARTTGHIDFDSAELRNYARSLNRK
jgi:hypothetical protein